MIFFFSSSLPKCLKNTGPLIADFFYVASGRRVFMGVRAANPLRAAELIPVIINTASKTPGAIAIAMQSSLFEQGLAAGRSIDIEIKKIVFTLEGFSI